MPPTMAAGGGPRPRWRRRRRERQLQRLLKDGLRATLVARRKEKAGGDDLQDGLACKDDCEEDVEGKGGLLQRVLRLQPRKQPHLASEKAKFPKH